MSSSTRWRGTTTLERGKVHRQTVASKITWTTDFQGPYEQCLASEPELGARITGFPAGAKVTSTNITQLDGDAGRIDVTLEMATSSEGFSTDPIGEPLYEIDWLELQKPLESHARCGILNPDRAFYQDGQKVPPVTPGPGVVQGGKQRTWDDWPQLTQGDVGDDGDYLSLNDRIDDEAVWDVETYKAQRESGQDSYITFEPVIKRTTIHLAKPLDTGAYSAKRQNPPSEANFTRVSGFEWLAGPDCCTKSGRTFTRRSEWRGAEVWGHSTYS